MAEPNFDMSSSFFYTLKNVIQHIRSIIQHPNTLDYIVKLRC